MQSICPWVAWTLKKCLAWYLELFIGICTMNKRWQWNCWPFRVWNNWIIPVWRLDLIELGRKNRLKVKIVQRTLVDVFPRNGAYTFFANRVRDQQRHDCRKQSRHGSSTTLRCSVRHWWDDVVEETGVTGQTEWIKDFVEYLKRFQRLTK